MIITISGDIGAGKSTVADILAKRLNYKRYSGGWYMRQMARTRGVEFFALTQQALADPSIDKEIDEWQKRIGSAEDDFVIDGRLSFHFIPNSYKICLEVDPYEGARRVLKSKRKDEQENVDIESTLANNARRRKIELKRYKKLYGVDPTDKSHYDVVIDTTGISADEVAKIILDKIWKRRKECDREKTEIPNV